jgi:deazaflavin-dependent oxidoreductase (nitroreductase family)
VFIEQRNTKFRCPMSRYRKPGWFTKHIFNGIVALATRLGISVWGSRVLWVKGRKSGNWHSTPVNLLNFDDDLYLVSPRGETQWVRNLRAIGSGELALGQRRKPFRVIEIQNESKPPILRAYLRRWKFEVGIFFEGVSATSPEEEFQRIAPEHPVFRILQ